MFNGLKITVSTQRAIQEAEKIVNFTMGRKIETSHLLYGLASVNGVSSEVLASFGITANRIWSVLSTTSVPQVSYMNGGVEFSSGAVDIIKLSGHVAKETSGEVIGTEHLLFAIVSRRDCKAVKIIESNFNVSAEDIKESLFKFFKESLNYNNANNMSQVNSGTTISNKLPDELKDLGIDLTERARSGKIDPIIGREKEIERAIEILCRKTKNNPILIGEAGVGKSAIAEGLALAIVSGDVPSELKEKTIFSLELGSLMAGTKYRGAMEEKLKSAIELLKSNGIIVFIDEIHTLIQAGSEKGEISPADMLKPYLARGELQTIGATTIDEYRKFIEQDKALERRFQPITVNPPSKEDTIKILQGIKSSYENFHNVVITDDAIKSAVELSDRYITDRNLPDKAIDLIDEASSRAKVHSKNKDVKVEIKNTDIEAIISKWTGVPVSKINETEAERLINLENILHERVIGQDQAVSEVSKALRRARMGLQDSKRPIGSFLFLGQTGVGKTELSKALAEAMFDSEKALIRLDMSEYMESHTISKMIGSPPGYVGHDDGGQLTEQVRRKPYSVVLFDEVEKAHPDVLNILLQILDDGRLTDSKGRVVNFKNTIIILTSNAGVSELKKKTQLGFGDVSDEEEHNKTSEVLLNAVKKQFKPELLNRLDSIIVFHTLTKRELAKIATIMITGLNKRLSQQAIELKLTEGALRYLVENGYDSEYGARPLRRLIQREIEDALADKLLLGEIEKGIIVIGESQGSLTFEK